jgi:transcription elongation factor GreA
MQATVEDRISKLEELLKNVVIISGREATGVVGVGSVVTVEKDKKSFVYTIVGSEESDVNTNKISIRSPFGQAILGKKKGEKFSFNAPNGELSYKVEDVK